MPNMGPWIFTGGFLKNVSFMILLLNENFQLTDQLPVSIVLVKRASTIPLVI